MFLPITYKQSKLTCFSYSSCFVRNGLTLLCGVAGGYIIGSNSIDLQRYSFCPCSAVNSLESIHVFNSKKLVF